MILIALVILLVVLAIFPTIRCALFHPMERGVFVSSRRESGTKFRRKK